MKVRIAMISACLIFATQVTFESPMGESAALVTPAIEVQCTLHDINDKPPDLDATVKFKWRASNAKYVLIKGRDNKRYSVVGDFSDSSGGTYTFIAVSGNQKARKPRGCYPSYRQGTGKNNLIWSINQNERVDQYVIKLSDTFEFGTTTSRENLENRITQLLREDYGLGSASRAERFDLVIYTPDYGVSKSLCDLDGCKPNGKPVERQIAFDILLEGKPDGTGLLKYEIYVTTDVLVRPEGKDDEWEIDPEAEKIGRPIAQRVAASIGKFLQ